jgi:cytochrome c oxidase subunit 2
VGVILVVSGYLAATRVNLMPEQASTRAVLVDQLFDVLIGIATVIFLLVEGVLLYAAFRFRRKKGDEADAVPVHGNARLEVIWTLIPALVVTFIAFYSYQVLAEGEKPEEDPMVVEVVGRQFTWEFRYPEQGISSQVLHLPVDRPVRFEITAEDVIHSFWIPEFRAKRDATPGQVSELVMRPIQTGTFPVRCAELCGPGHSAMETQVVVEPLQDFEAWTTSQVAALSGTAATGSELFLKYGCQACHTLSDAQASGMVGPALDGIGSTAANRVPGMDARAYLTASIVEPGAFLVPGYPDGVMPLDLAKRIPEADLQVLVDYLLSQK